MLRIRNCTITQNIDCSPVYHGCYYIKITSKIFLYILEWMAGGRLHIINYACMRTFREFPGFSRAFRFRKIGRGARRKRDPVLTMDVKIRKSTQILYVYMYIFIRLIEGREPFCSGSKLLGVIECQSVRCHFDELFLGFPCHGWLSALNVTRLNWPQRGIFRAESGRLRPETEAPIIKEYT